MGWGSGPPLGCCVPPHESCVPPHRYTYEIAPVFVLMEEVVLAKLRELVGWSSGDGIFSPGTRIAPGGLSSSPSPSPNPRWWLVIPARDTVVPVPLAGGSISNMYAMNVARFHRFPESRRKGNWALPRLALFTSQEVRRGV